MALIVIGLFVFGGGALGAYFFVYSPLQDKWEEADKIQSEITELDKKLDGIAAARPKIVEAKRQSLPNDPSQAKTEYKLLLENLLTQAKFVDYKIPEARTVERRSPVTPDLTLPNATNPQSPIKKQAYTTLEFRIEIKKADIWQVVDFLQAFYRLDLLHQITELTITRDNKPTEARTGLELHITCEAIILDNTDSHPAGEQEQARRKIDPRPALFPVTTAVGAIGGNLAIEAVARKQEVARKLTPVTSTPVLATANRDYSLIPLLDMFYGPIPKEKPAPAFALARIDSVEIKNPEESSTVRVRVSGEGSTGAKIAATASGSLLPEGAMTVDQKTHTITIPKVDEILGSTATSTVSVVATSADGKTLKESFKVAMGKAPEKKDTVAGPDISAAIKLIMVSGGSDGTLSALIFDAANPFKYQVTADAKAVKVLKMEQATKARWREDSDYNEAKGVLAFSDDFSSTKRAFKVIAVEHDAIIITEITKHETAKSQPGRGGRPGGFVAPPAAKHEPVDPLAILVGNAPLSIPTPELYRWPLGLSLKDVFDPKKSLKLSPEEARKVLKRVAAEGPLGPTTVAASDGR
jgi:hypothetical protein